MDPEAFTSTERGTVRRALEGYWTFIPAPLPRQITYSSSVVEALDAATAALHRLAGVGRLLPNATLLMGPHVRLEAVLSSRIEGTQADVDELLRFETGQPIRPGENYDDVAEVSNYLLALNHGLSRLAEIPLCLRLLREIHQKLLEGVRGNYATPGDFRRTPNWIGGSSPENAIFVPPPVDEMRVALADWERFLHEQPFPLLVQLALAHYQFEAIHPFLDGNGRVGRLLIPLMLCERGVLQQPLLYLSAYFERNRAAYYDLLGSTSQRGDPDPWLQFFLEGVRSQATDAEERTVRLVELQVAWRDELHQSRASITAIRLAEILFESPYVTNRSAQKRLGVSKPATQAAIAALVERGHLREVTGRPRGRMYFAHQIFEAVYQETSEQT